MSDQAFIMSPHATSRAIQRGISDALIQAALDFGLRIKQGRRRAYFLGHKQLQMAQKYLQLRGHAEGTVVVQAKGGIIVTVARGTSTKKIRRRQS